MKSPVKNLLFLFLFMSIVFESFSQIVVVRIDESNLFYVPKDESLEEFKTHMVQEKNQFNENITRTWEDDKKLVTFVFDFDYMDLTHIEYHKVDGWMTTHHPITNVYGDTISEHKMSCGVMFDILGNDHDESFFYFDKKNDKYTFFSYHPIDDYPRYWNENQYVDWGMNNLFVFYNTVNTVYVK